MKTLKRPITTKVVCFWLSAEMFNSFLTDNVEPNQTAPKLSDMGPHHLPPYIYIVKIVRENVQQMTEANSI